MHIYIHISSTQTIAVVYNECTILYIFVVAVILRLCISILMAHSYFISEIYFEVFWIYRIVIFTIFLLFPIRYPFETRSDKYQTKKINGIYIAFLKTEFKIYQSRYNVYLRRKIYMVILKWNLIQKGFLFRPENIYFNQNLNWHNNQLSGIS